MKKIAVLIMLALILLVVGISLAEETNAQIFIPGVVLMDPVPDCRYWYTNGGIVVSCDGMDPNLYPNPTP